jgi:maltose O-acetyltransferase
VASVLNFTPPRAHLEALDTGIRIEPRVLEPSSRRRSFLERLTRAAREELAVAPQKEAIGLISRAFPQFALNRTRTALLRAAGVPIGSGTMIMGPLRLTGEGPVSLLSFGRNTQISGPLHVDLGARVSIGDRIHFGQEVMLLTMEHEIGSAEERCGRLTTAPICIEDGAWLASRVTILPGVTVGRGSVVAAGAVVTADVPPNSLVGGMPARLIRSLDDCAPRSLRRDRARPANDGR